MKLTIEVREDEYFLKLLSFLHALPPFNKLTKQELYTLAALLELNYKYRKVPFIERNKLLFGTRSRKRVTEMVGMNYNNLYNLIQRLRKKGFVEKYEDEDTLVLNPKYALKKTASLTILFEDNE